MKTENKIYYNNKPYKVAEGKNGFKYVVLESVRDDTCNVSDGNNKTGKEVGCFNFPIEYSCDRHCECYLLKACYACGGMYAIPDNQATYAENMSYFLAHDNETIINELVSAIKAGRWEKFRYFTCGDIPTVRFFEIMVAVAELLPGVKFWAYTKKYSIVNSYVKNHGGSIAAAIPENLVILFSHWLNNDGTYFPMYNPYGFPTSEFIPMGKENLVEDLHITHICPCSDETVAATCNTCDHPCYTLKPGESMALLEHSTKATKKRDARLKAAHNAIKEAAKADRKRGKKTA